MRFGEQMEMIKFLAEFLLERRDLWKALSSLLCHHYRAKHKYSPLKGVRDGHEKLTNVCYIMDFPGSDNEMSVYVANSNDNKT